MNKNLEYYKRLPYQIITKPVTDSDGTHYWLAKISELRGCKTEGETETEAITNLQGLFDEYIEVTLEENIDVPEPESQPQSASETVWKDSKPTTSIVKNPPREETSETEGRFEKTNIFTYQPSI